ncbi:MAG: RHS repeat-associated core domain-containing protein [Planctomycetota bacterium]
MAAVHGAEDVNVDPLSGELELARVDLELGSRGVGYALTRTYRAGLGGWHWACDTRLELGGARPVWIDEEGRTWPFEPAGSGWVASVGAPHRLEVLADGWRLEAGLRSYRFDLAGRVVERVTEGTSLAFRHGPSGAVAVRGPWGELRLERDGRGVQRAALGAREVRYAYAAGRLTGVVRGARREVYAYDAQGRVSAVDGTAVVYDGAGRVVGLTGERLPLTATYAEVDGGFEARVRDGARETRTRYRPGPRPLLEQEEAGVTRSLRFDARQRPELATVDGAFACSWSYDAAGRTTRVDSPQGALELDYAGRGWAPSAARLPTGEALRFVRDPAGRLLATVDARGTARYAYDAQGWLVERVDPDGGRTRIRRDAVGAVLALEGPQGTTRFLRGADGSLAGVVDPDGREVRYVTQGAALKVQDARGTVRAAAFDARGRLIAYQDELGRAERVEYDAQGQIARCFDREGDRFRCSYDARGQLVAFEDAAGNRVRYTRPDPRTLIVDDPSAGRRELSFDAAGRVVREVRGGEILRFRYDAQGQLVARETPAGEERFTYDARGLLLAQAGPDGELRYTYDAQGRLRSCENRVLFQRIDYRYEGASTQPAAVRYPWGTVAYRYDPRGRLVEVRAGEARVAIERDAAGRRARVVYPGGVETRYAWTAGRLEEVATWRDDALLVRRAYTYDARGRVAAVLDEAGRETRFDHDRRGRLVREQGPERDARYAYDALGTRVGAEVDGAALEVRPGAGSRLAQQGEAALAYDPRGALVARGAWRFSVDVDGRLTEARGPEGQRVRYGYAPDGTPLWRDADGVREAYLVDRQQVVGDYTDGALTRRYLRGEDLDDTLLVQAGSQRWAFHRDLVGSVTALTDDAGRVAARYAYGAFGEALSAEGPAAETNRWRFAGRPLDPATGLYDLRARRYDPTLGRFTSPDPSGREGGLNLYAYAENDPTRLTDPLGLAPELGARSADSAAPRGGFFSRVLAQIERAGQSLPPQQRLNYNLVKGVGQAAQDTVVGIGELFQKETWVALGEFVGELDDWETVKAVGGYVAGAAVDLGERYLDAALNDPDEFARMTGYGAGMIVGGVLGTKGVDKLAKIARAAKAARAAAPGRRGRGTWPRPAAGWRESRRRRAQARTARPAGSARWPRPWGAGAGETRPGPGLGRRGAAGARRGLGGRRLGRGHERAVQRTDPGRRARAGRGAPRAAGEEAPRGAGQRRAAQRDRAPGPGGGARRRGARRRARGRLRDGAGDPRRPGRDRRGGGGGGELPPRRRPRARVGALRGAVDPGADPGAEPRAGRRAGPQRRHPRGVARRRARRLRRGLAAQGLRPGRGRRRGHGRVRRLVPGGGGGGHGPDRAGGPELPAVGERAPLRGRQRADLAPGHGLRAAQARAAAGGPRGRERRGVRGRARPGPARPERDADPGGGEGHGGGRAQPGAPRRGALKRPLTPSACGTVQRRTPMHRAPRVEPTPAPAPLPGGRGGE